MWLDKVEVQKRLGQKLLEYHKNDLFSYPTTQLILQSMGFIPQNPTDSTEHGSHPTPPNWWHRAWVSYHTTQLMAQSMGLIPHHPTDGTEHWSHTTSPTDDTEHGFHTTPPNWWHRAWVSYYTTQLIAKSMGLTPHHQTDSTEHVSHTTPPNSYHRAWVSYHTTQLMVQSMGLIPHHPTDSTEHGSHTTPPNWWYKAWVSYHTTQLMVQTVGIIPHHLTDTLPPDSTTNLRWLINENNRHSDRKKLIPYIIPIVKEEQRFWQLSFEPMTLTLCRFDVWYVTVSDHSAIRTFEVRTCCASFHYR